jgi:drug/metabolite transporter (DMT)-like permease
VRNHSRRFALAVAGIISAVAIGIALENDAGIPFDTSYRFGCATACLIFIFKLQRDYPTERWPKLGLIGSMLINLLIFFTPLVSRPASRGELMVFALPDAIIVLAVLIASYNVQTVHQRALRQQMIFGLIVALGFNAVIFTLILIGPQPQRLR